MPYRFSRGKRYKRSFIRRLASRGLYVNPTGKFARGTRRIVASMKQPFHNFVRTQETTIVVDDTANPVHYCGTGNQNYYSLDMLQNYTEFEALYDQYRILAVRQTFIYSSTGAQQATDVATATSMPLIGTVIDRDDATALTAVTDYDQYESLKIKRVEKPFSRYFHPCLAKAVYAGVAFSGYAQERRGTWVDMTSHDAQYYGLKWYVDPIIAGAGTHHIGRLRIITKIYFQCRDVR